MTSSIVKMDNWYIFQCIMNEYKDNLFMGEDAVRSPGIRLRARQKILSWISSKNLAQTVIDDNTASLLDNLYRLAKNCTKDKKQAKKMINQIIKIVVKITVLQKNNVFNTLEKKIGERFKTEFHTAVMTVITFYEINNSYNHNILIDTLNLSQWYLVSMVAKHFTEKSLCSIESLFEFFMYKPYLNYVFHQNSEQRELLGRIVANLHTSIERGKL